MSSPDSSATPDSSVLVAGFASWHQDHRTALAALSDARSAIGHALLETYSVLTRLPAPHRVTPGVAGEFLSARFPGTALVLDGEQAAALTTSLPARGLVGGRVYDALIAETARVNDVELLTLDARALPTYELMGCRFRMLAR